MAKPPFLYKNTLNNINDYGKTKIKNMYNNLENKNASIYKRNFEGVSEICEKDMNKGVCTKQNRSVERGSKRNYVRFLLTKKP